MFGIYNFDIFSDFELRISDFKEEVVIGKSTGKQKTIQARPDGPLRTGFVFSDETNKAGIRNTEDELEVNYVWDL